MSEVYIRSQNKEKLYRLGGNYACVEYGEYEDVKKKRGSSRRSSICDDMHSKSGVDNNSASMDIAVCDMEKGSKQ